MTADSRAVARTALLLFGALTLQLAVIDDLRLFSVHPELLLAVAIGSAVAWGPERGAVVGFAAGLLTDLFLTGRFGITALSFALAGYGIGVFADSLARRSRLLDAALLAAGSAGGIALYAVVGTLFGAGTLGDDHLVRIIALVAAYAALLSPAVMPLCRWAGESEMRLRPSR